VAASPALRLDVAALIEAVLGLYAKEAPPSIARHRAAVRDIGRLRGPVSSVVYSAARYEWTAEAKQHGRQIEHKPVAAVVRTGSGHVIVQHGCQFSTS